LNKFFDNCLFTNNISFSAISDVFFLILSIFQKTNKSKSTHPLAPSLFQIEGEFNIEKLTIESFPPHHNNKSFFKGLKPPC
jgi:hypothetical protein